MKFGIFTIVPWHESKGQQQSLDESLAQIELADQLGLEILAVETAAVFLLEDPDPVKVTSHRSPVEWFGKPFDPTKA